MNVQDDPCARLNEPQEAVPQTPPDLEEDSALKGSRKREREVSLEPSTPQTTTSWPPHALSRPPHPGVVHAPSADPMSQDIEHPSAEHKERRVPKKKNRVSSNLDATQEESDEDSGSPPLETKMRQISQGVEDITWQNPTTPAEQPSADGDHEMDAASTPAPAVAAADADTQEPIEAKSTEGEEIQVPPALLQGENPPLVSDGAGDDEHAGEADPAEVPPHAQPEDPEQVASTDVHPEVSSTSAIPPVATSPPLSRHGSESDTDQEKGLKRKFADGTVSERLLASETSLGPNGIAPQASKTKRQRDDPDADANPRVNKRPTPPPEEEDRSEGSQSSGSQEKDSGPPSKRASQEVVSPIPTSSTTAPKLSGFMAYASTTSPFASVSGPNVFGSRASTSSTPALASTSASPHPSPAPSASPFSSGSPSKSPEAQAQAHKRRGFEAFAASASPFASAAKRPRSPPPLPFGRSRSPARPTARAVSAFTAYAAGGAQAFSAHSTPRRGSPALGEGSSVGANALANPFAGGRTAGLSVFGQQDSVFDDDDARGQVSFGERLRAQKDDDEEEEEEKRMALTEQEVLTGEEDEETVYQVRGKLFALSSQNQWKERGTGTLRLNVRREDGTGARLVMRKEAVYTVILNVTLFKGMRCFTAQDPRYLRFSVLEGGHTTHYNLRVQSQKIAEELLEEITSHIPTE
ncbi:hypothetical protein WOLCODRAFT_166904 [Wolfiporia cocos MD-104 SS10]|uniref:RanBD1 domain-containing protein n=1 Tax=Wolfiporia cocos (strain MD-104) TaxID=742152 RepID=A0A2H3JK74_WOLCO|nr:hypothetical protein WOLCODRAFT_166904 [Wolfiporia cocos MD-104 SS10]